MAGGHIIVDRTLKTNIDGVYAAGDCTGADLYSCDGEGCW